VSLGGETGRAFGGTGLAPGGRVRPRVWTESGVDRRTKWASPRPKWTGGPNGARRNLVEPAFPGGTWSLWTRGGGVAVFHFRPPGRRSASLGHGRLKEARDRKM